MNEGIVIPVAVFAMVVLIVWIGHKSKVSRLQELVEMRKRLLDKFSSGTELSEFLATPQGQSFLKDQEIGATDRSPKGKMISSVGAGIILVMLGAAFFVLMNLERDLIYPGAILVALGLGFLIAAAISYQLYKKWNMLK
ncbi:MAG: hypothetical protein JXA73_02545 [Acidobacteria bacterium]|nr:hypothetical protein [Acidobacteriota bacterium]